MKKITEFLKQPFTTTLMCVVGLSLGFGIGTAVDALILKQSRFLKKKASCKEAFETLCVQVHACTGDKVSECDAILSEKELCNSNLPGIETIETCEDELRNIECDSDLPASCSLFMDAE
jgi:hypothetical protein